MVSFVVHIYVHVFLFDMDVERLRLLLIVVIIVVAARRRVSIIERRVHDAVAERIFSVVATFAVDFGRLVWQ